VYDSLGTIGKAPPRAERGFGRGGKGKRRKKKPSTRYPTGSNMSCAEQKKEVKDTRKEMNTERWNGSGGQREGLCKDCQAS